MTGPERGDGLPAARAFLADFGLAKSVATGSRLTRTGQALGTPAYMSPEQARGEVSSLTAATDAWSLGCVLYAMLAGRSPFSGDTPAAVVAAVLTHEPRGLLELCPDAPRHLPRVVGRALRKSRASRYRDAAALGDDLSRILAGERPATSLPGTPAGRLIAAGATLGVAIGIAALLPGRATTDPGSPAAAPPGNPAAEGLALRALRLRQSDPREATETLARALEVEPHRHGWRVERGLLLWGLGRTADARTEWERIPDGAPEAPAARLYAALEAMSGGDGGLARCEVTRAEADPGGDGRVARAVSAALRADWTGARECLREVPGWSASLVRGYVEGTDPRGDAPAAVREYEAALAEGPPSAWAYHNLGVARAAAGDHAGALEAFGRSLRLRPGDPVTHFSRGVSRDVTRDYAGAIEDYSAALERRPDYFEALNNRGYARRRAGDAAGALGDYEAAVRLRPDLPGPRRNRGIVRQELGNVSGALEDFDRALREGPPDAELYNDRGLARHAAGEYAGAVEDYTRALALRPDMEMALSNRALALEAL
ncbi:MAG: tetratricopeptide repeat-containing serine/threonine-protein kinase, partial [Planctomycetales bacterium]|nr:tetratricopeptide repeat-containing serine/threonine-protein kinase [Planctomycetales bacterium]